MDDATRKRFGSLEQATMNLCESIMDICNILENHEHRITEEVADRREAITQIEVPQ